jgi:hypothetical protein
MNRLFWILRGGAGSVPIVNLALLVCVAQGCAARREEQPVLRSPSLDYRPPGPTTVEGKPVGADNVAPADRLKEGAQLGNESALAPGWSVDKKKGLSHSPKRPASDAKPLPDEQEKH